METRYHSPGRYESTARMSPDGCHAPSEYDRNGLPVSSVPSPLPSSANIMIGCSPLTTNRCPSKICIQGGTLLSESITTFRWWWIQVLLCGLGIESRMASQ